MQRKHAYYDVGVDGKTAERLAALISKVARKRERPGVPFSNEDCVWKELANAEEAELNVDYLNRPRGELVELFVRRPRLVLDIGCATGATGALIKTLYPEARVLGIEPNRAAAHIAESRLDKVYCQRIEEINFAAEGIGEGSIDTVILADVLEHMVDPWSTMLRLKPFLAPNAQILASIPNIRNLWVMNELAQGRWRYEKAGLLDVTHLRFFTLEEVQRFFRETGYKVLKVASAPDIRCMATGLKSGSSDLEMSKIVIKNVSSDELLELRTLQFLVLATPLEEALPAEVIEQVRRADLHVAHGDLAAAQQALTQALQIVPNDTQLIVALGNILLRLGDVEAARREFVKATVLAPGHVPGHSNLAAVLLHLGHAEEAEASARRALALNPTDTDSLKVLARLCLDNERYNEAVQAYMSILRHSPNDVETLLILANCYTEVGRFEDAKTFYQRALQLDPGNAVATENLALVSQAEPSDVAASGQRGERSDAPRTPHPAPRASIVIVTYNSASTIRACLESVFQCSRSPFEVIVVDNASTDKTRSILDEYRGRITVVLNTENRGFSAACNQGIRASAGEYVVLLNPDTAVTSGWLDRLIAHCGPNVGAVGPVSDYVAGLQKVGLYLPEQRPNALSLAEAGDLLGRVNARKAVEARLLIGFCMVLPRKVLDEVGLLDEELFLGNDDLDLSWRLRERGYRLLIATDAFVHHEGQVSFKSEPSMKTARLVQESTDRLYAKLEAHYGRGSVPDPMELWGINWFKPTQRCEVRSAKSARTPHPAPRTSIIILTHNGLEHTEQCLASIEAHTPEPHELIIVDNGSTDGTLDYLRDYMATHSHVRVIANLANRGFAAGNNQGLALARGDYVLLLNNDTIVTEGWLGRMLSHFERHPEVGIIGPMSNYVSGPQLVRDAAYTSGEELERFATRWAAEHAGQSAQAVRVVGFCLLARRAVIERVGGLDEQFGSGNFEDDDLCIRAAQVGYGARIAQDVFIHHTGSQTFKAAKIDYRQSLMRNWALFKTKWKIPADAPYEKGYRLPLALADGFRAHIPLPEVNTDHEPQLDGRWWQEVRGARGSKFDVQSSGKEAEPISAVVLANGHGLTPLWPSLVQHTSHPLAVLVSAGYGNGGTTEPQPACPEGWQISTVDVAHVRLLNQSLQSAHDEPVILLSSDLVLTPGWLKRLLAALTRDQSLAAVGPTSNHGAAAQRVKAEYKGTGKALRQFALRRAHRYGGQVAEVDSLAPCCIVFNRAVCRFIGLLREDLDLAASLGDYFARLRQAGRPVAVALDAYVHCRDGRS